ncbi:hypothetical protein MMC16_005991 [Acarospora aff. strigata]|nr:hypothetical protein [Acarospora aff. strigata]
MSSSNANARGFNPYTGRQDFQAQYQPGMWTEEERRRNDMPSADDAVDMGINRQGWMAGPRPGILRWEGWVDENGYDVTRVYRGFGERQRRQPGGVGWWVEGVIVDDRDFAPRGPNPASMMPGAYQQPNFGQQGAANAIWADPAQHSQLQRDAQRRAARCRGCGGDHKQWDCPTRPVCERCDQPGHRKENCPASGRDRRTNRSRAGHPMFGFNIRRQQQQLEEDEARLREGRRAEQRRRDAEEEEEVRLRQSRRAEQRRRDAEEEEEIRLRQSRRAEQRRRDAEEEEEARLREGRRADQRRRDAEELAAARGADLRQRVEVRTRVPRGPPLKAPTQGHVGPPPNAPTGPRALARPSPILGGPRMNKGPQRPPANPQRLKGGMVKKEDPDRNNPAREPFIKREPEN